MSGRAEGIARPAPPAAEYDPHGYWNRLVSGELELRMVGHDEMPGYNEVAYRLRLRALERALARLRARGAQLGSVLECGFGVGFYLGRWKGLGFARVAGVDLSRSAVEHARRRFPGYRVEQADLSGAMPFGGETFDLCTAIDVLYHVTDDAAWERAVANLAARVRPGGYLVVTDKFPAREAYQSFPHVRRRTLAEYRAALAAGGLEVESVTPVFVLMDDPVPTGAPPLLARLSWLQWRMVNRLARAAGAGGPRMARFAGRALALLQLPFEAALLGVVKRSPNLELLVARRPGEAG